MRGPPELLKVMTLNVRQPDQDDGVNAWENRKGLLLDTILTSDPDLIGTQELFALQAEYISTRASHYAWFGTGRFGDARDKHVGIFYKRDKLRLIESGDFWLSETPDVSGSSSWNIIRPRQVSWGQLETEAGHRFHHYNTHFPYRKEEQHARVRTADLLLQRIGLQSPVLLTADFNSSPDGEIYRHLTAAFQDAWPTARDRSGPEATLNGFGKAPNPRRLDWILYRANWSVLLCETIATSCDGIYPSDHYPVVAVFNLVS